MTHWQHPSFFAYFPANNSPPSILAEMLTATMGAQCMSWATSPAATELEERMMQWLGEMIGPPSGIHRGHTGYRLHVNALLDAHSPRTSNSTFRVNAAGFQSNTRYAVYTSTETHSSIERAVENCGAWIRRTSQAPRG